MQMSYFHKLCKTPFLMLMLLIGFWSTYSHSALIETELTPNAYITQNGFDWAWGGRCVTKSFRDCDTLDFAFQAALGWRIAVSSDMLLAPTALDFLFAGGNVPFEGVDPISGASFNFTNAVYTLAASAGACASAYFTLGDGLNSCDWGNGGGQDTNTVGWFNQNGESNFFADVLFIRVASTTPNPNPVPAPSTMFIFGGGLIGLIALRRRKNA